MPDLVIFVLLYMSYVVYVVGKETLCRDLWRSEIVFEVGSFTKPIIFHFF